jgi:hypothetical protein
VGTGTSFSLAQSEEPSFTNAEDTTVSTFHRTSGHRTFDAQLLTPPFRMYWAAEELCLERYVRRVGARHVVELGAGDGRLRAWAGVRGLDYDGVDPSGSCSDDARWRWSETRSRVHCASAEELDQLFASERISGDTSVVFFPFNCFGNLARPSVVAHAIARTRSRALISTYTDNPLTRELRLDYYARCGYTGLIVESKPGIGSVIRSREGLRAYVFDASALYRMFATAGYTVEDIELGGIGRAYACEPAR